jgi:carbon monoxide dehydrogenase subunit G
MTTFESSTVINRPVNDVYIFLKDMNNHHKLMPENVQDWSSTMDEASLMIQNMIKLSLKISERVENETIRIITIGKQPFEIGLQWQLFPNNGETKVVYTIKADLNMMMKMMASGPLQKLADHEVHTLANVLS